MTINYAPKPSAATANRAGQARKKHRCASPRSVAESRDGGLAEQRPIDLAGHVPPPPAPLAPVIRHDNRRYYGHAEQGGIAMQATAANATRRPAAWK